MKTALAYGRVLLKLSGEALGTASPVSFNSSASSVSKSSHPLHAKVLSRVAQDIAEVVALGVQVGIVIGGGNWFRGADEFSNLLISRITADYIGMLATVMNALTLRDALLQKSVATRVMSAFPIEGVTETFEVHRARRHLAHQRVVIFSGGTGHPLVSTDAAASLRGLQIEADILLKATSVDGVYSADPESEPEAQLYKHLSYREVLASELGVMDLAAFCQCRDYGLPIRVFNVNTPQGLLRVVQGESIGTLVD